MEFKELTDSKDAFPSIGSEALDLFNSITPVDIALSVPYVKIWQINEDGRPKNADSNGRPKGPISLKLVEPPPFGSSTATTFRERPAVSLEGVQVKTQLSRGDYTIRTIQLNIIAHKPSAVFAEDDPGFDNWSSLLSPGSLHVLEYGWSGSSKNDLINGAGFAKDGEAIESRTQIIILVSHYEFELSPGGEISFTIHANENGGNLLEKAVVAAPPKETPLGRELINFYSPKGKKLRKDAQESMKKIFESAKSDGKNKTKNGVSLKKVLDTLFADVIDKVIKLAGYQQVELFLGKFNSQCYNAKGEFGGSLAGKSIGDFVMTIDDLSRMLGDLLASGRPLNMMDLLFEIISFIGSDSIWVSDDPDAERQTKHKPVMKLKMKTFIDNSGSSPKRKARIYIIDATTQWIEFNQGDLLDPNTPRKTIVDKLKQKKVPLIPMRYALSTIEEGSFRVILDSKIKTDAIQRSLKAGRVDVVSTPSADLKEPRTRPEDIAFASSIQGTFSMLGNFIFDSFAVVWLEFGVKQLDGTFYITEKVDTIGPGSFTSQYTVLATGEDPLGTQGIRESAL